jgi:hypothetical protein
MQSGLHIESGSLQATRHRLVLFSLISIVAPTNRARYFISFNPRASVFCRGLAKEMPSLVMTSGSGALGVFNQYLTAPAMLDGVIHCLLYNAVQLNGDARIEEGIWMELQTAMNFRQHRSFCRKPLKGKLETAGIQLQRVQAFAS